MSTAEKHALLLRLANRPIGRLRWRLVRTLIWWIAYLALGAWGVPGIAALLIGAVIAFGPYLAWLNGRLAEALRCEAMHRPDLYHHPA